ncbi:Uu.00g014130.m01.CDS01 [Anthostomella pinea]|uniref:Uu.00g014130.m01.CDS01 n=1 Tax=Anthostomella pinea TaxID=933095 RepID=A0AAI8YQ82_9PEZI|nr:Uu.00g014130.m01.CDS01 [Anthostomella pinea]
MADPAPETGFKPGLDFMDNSSLTYFIPLATNFRVDDVVEGTKAPYQELFDSIERRESLFFDESVDVFLVLRTPHVPEDTLRSSLKRLVISLEAHIVNGNAPDRDSPPALDVIYTGTVDESEVPTILVEDSTDDGEPQEAERTQHAFAIWKLSVFLGRPRIRLYSPSVVFAATASLKPADVSLSNDLRDGYMASGVAAGLNLLESFGSDPAMNGVKPRLSALRVSRVAPVTQQEKDLLRPVKSLPKLSLRIYPVIHSRMRFTHPNTAPATAAVIAILEVDFTPFFECEVNLENITLSIPGGTVQNLTSQPGMSLPLSCVAHDHVTFLYRVAPAEADLVARSPMRDLDITISATALVHPDLCMPRLNMAWTAAVDFTIPVNPGYGSTTQPIQRSHRPSQLSIGGESTTSLIAPSVARPDALPALEASTKSETTVQELGVTMTFMAPPANTKVFLGDEFVWSVFVANKSPNSTAPPRKLALVVIPKRRRHESRVNRPPSVSRPSEASYARSTSKAGKDRAVADAVLDDQVVHAMQRSSIIDSAEVACLSADVRIGPLAPGACHVAELKFLALKEGIVNIEAVRVVDLVSNEHVDIKDLPTVLVESSPEE